jgi:hypothetical protein
MGMIRGFPEFLRKLNRALITGPGLPQFCALNACSFTLLSDLIWYPDQAQGYLETVRSRHCVILRLLYRAGYRSGDGLDFPFAPFFPGQSRFFHIISRSPGFISNVPLFRCSSVTLIFIDNRSLFSAIGISVTILTLLVANLQNKISQIVSFSVVCVFFFHHLCW